MLENVWIEDEVFRSWVRRQCLPNLLAQVLPPKSWDRKVMTRDRVLRRRIRDVLMALEASLRGCILPPSRLCSLATRRDAYCDGRPNPAITTVLDLIVEGGAMFREDVVDLLKIDPCDVLRAEIWSSEEHLQIRTILLALCR